MTHHGKCFWRPEEPFPYPDPCPYEWTLAGDIFASPIVTNSSVKTVTFPLPGVEWVDWWNEDLVYNAYVERGRAVHPRLAYRGAAERAHGGPRWRAVVVGTWVAR